MEGAPADPRPDDAPSRPPPGRRRRRRHRSRGRGPRWWRRLRRRVRRWRRRHSLVPYLLAAVVLLGIAGAVLAWSAWEVRGELQDARTDVAGARSAVGDGDIETALQRLDAADARVDSAQARTGRFLWRVGAKVPLAGRSLRVVIAVTDTADAAVDATRDAVVRMDDMLGPSGRFEVQVSDGRVQLASIGLAHEALQQIPVERLEAATARLADLEVTWVPDLVRDGRRDTLELAHQALDTFHGARTLTGALPGFLGADGPRRYLLALQNNAELRGTGGLIGLWGTVEADDGELTLGDMRPLADLQRDDLDPVDAPEGFVERYGHVNAAGFFTNVNVDPDLPTVAPVMVDLAGTRTGQRYDGVIAVDPIALETILGPVGPIEVPEEAVAGYDVDVPRRVPPDEIGEVTMVRALTDRTSPSDEDERDRYLTAVGRAAFERLFAGDWDAVEVTRALADAAGRRHLQLYSNDADEQAAFEQLGIAGAVRPDGEDADLLALSANNAAGNKMDVHVGHAASGTVQLHRAADGTVSRTATVEVAVDNPLPTTGMDQLIIGSMPTSRDGTPQDYTGEPGLNRTWFTLWAPGETNLVGAFDDDGEEIFYTVDRLHGHLGVDHFLETPSRSTAGFRVDLSGPVTVRRDGPDLVYRFTWWRQAKAIPDRLDLRIVGPEGWDVAEVAVHGGGRGAGMGAFGEPGPRVDASAGADGVVGLAGDVDRDVSVEIRYTRGLRARLSEWLRAPVF